jgi:uncharacterized alpha-E superfamily protein
MIMLSRVAERLYWTARYIERVEDTARLVGAYHHLIMDIPRGSEPGWDVLIRILDADTQFYQRYRAANEQNVLKFLLAEQDSPCSIPFAIEAARENVRTTRDVLPEDAWEYVNELHLYCSAAAEKSVGRRNRYEFLQNIVGRCQRLNGLLLTSLSRDHAARFLKIGQLLERSDMTTRVIDVGAGDILDREGVFAAIDPLLWGALLHSLSAQGAYRRKIGPLVEKVPVIDFVFKEPTLPRSVAYCLRGVRQELTSLRNSDESIRLLNRSRRKLSRFNPDTASREQLHQFIDRFQLDLNEIHIAIRNAWFLPADS